VVINGFTVVYDLDITTIFNSVTLQNGAQLLSGGNFNINVRALTCTGTGTNLIDTTGGR
jgi:hypothetical protein